MKTTTTSTVPRRISGRHVKADAPTVVRVSTLKVNDTIVLPNGRNACVKAIHGNALTLVRIKTQRGDADLAGHTVREVTLTGRFETYTTSGRKAAPKAQAKATPKAKATRNDALAKARAVKAAKKALADAMAL